MATNRAMLRRRRVFAAKVETTTGTPESLSASDGAMNVFDREIEPTVNMGDRPQQGSMSMLEMVPGTRQATVNVTTQMHGSGSSGVPLWASTLLASCGFTLSGSTYSPDSTSETTTTQGLYEDGRLRRVAGCKGTFEWTFNSGEPVDCSWTMTGKMIEPNNSQSLITPTFPTTLPPRFASATMTVASTTYKISQLTITANNDVQLREDVEADDDPNRSGDGTGYHAAEIVNRGVQLTIDPEASTSKNWYKDMLDGTTASFQAIVGDDTNNTMTIDAPKVQLADVQPGNRNEMLTDNLTFNALADSDGGDDELTIQFS